MSPQPALHAAMVSAVPQLRAFALKLCRNADQADDLVQETIALGCKGIGHFEPGTNMIAWLTTILRNHFLSERRRASYRLVDPLEDYVDTLSVSPTQLASVESDELRVALKQLSQDECSALVLVLGAGYSYEEVSDLSGCPAGTVKSRVSRARRKIASLLLGEQQSPVSSKAWEGWAAAAPG
jgi:RNA polymerase sigma-70 factor, ECF subfamily